MMCASALAQTRFCMGGDLDHLSAAQRASCSATLQNVRDVAASLHAPDSWHFVVVCGEDGWRQYAAYSVDREDRLSGASADTDLERHETFLREKDIQAGSLSFVTRLIAHEVAISQLHSRDQQAIQTQMLRLLEQHRPNQGT